MADHEIRVSAFILSLLEKGKDLEVRVAMERFKKIREGDILSFSPRCSRRVKAIRKYQDFVQMLNSERPERIAPGYEDEIIRVLQRIYSREQERLGVLVFELEPIISATSPRN